MKQITPKQQKILQFIETQSTQKGVPPTYREIMTKLGYASPASVLLHIRALRKKGYLANAPLAQSRSFVSKRKSHTAIPLVGRIAAGVPLESIENIEKTFDLSSLGFDNSDNRYFALRVQGDSMINAHILNGDIVIIKKQPTAAAHEIAAVQIDNEATLKYVKKQGSTLTLTPANDTLQPFSVDLSSSTCSILGIMAAAIRVNR